MESLHKLCELGKVLTAEQARLLKLIGEKMVSVPGRAEGAVDFATEEGGCD